MDAGISKSEVNRICTELDGWWPPSEAAGSTTSASRTSF
jgi:hypothetical protein